MKQVVPRTRVPASRSNGCALEPLEARTLFAALPRPSHIVIVVEENRDYADLFSPGGNSSAPYMNKLARYGALFTRAHSVTTGSQPSYLATFSGSTHGLSPDDVDPHNFPGPSLGGQLRAKGLTFAGFSEDLPHAGFTGISSGNYVRRHNPWVEFADVPAIANQPFSNFPRNLKHLPTVSFVAPNLQHDMHDGTIRQADDWLRTNLGAYIAWAPKHNSLLIVTWDEGHATAHIPTFFYGANVRRGRDRETFNNYKLLRTIEDMYGLKPLGEAANNGAATHAFVAPTSAAVAMARPARSVTFLEPPTRLAKDSTSHAIDEVASPSRFEIL